MSNYKGIKKRKIFDYDADWVPQKDRQFVLKQAPPQQEERTDVKHPLDKTTDAQGLKAAYSAESGFYRDPEGTLHVAGTRGSLAGEDWRENYRVYGPGLVSTLKDYYGLLSSGKFGFNDWFAPDSQPFNIEDTKTHKALDQYMKDNPGEVKNYVAHSKGASVVEKWMENHPEWTGHARLYGAPHVDPIGSEAAKDKLNQWRKERNDTYKDSNFLVRGANWIQDKEQDALEWWTGFDKVKGMRENRQMRISGEMDPFTALDGSAMRLKDPTWLYHLKEGGGRYFGNIAGLYAGFDGADGDGFIGRLNQPWDDVAPANTDPAPQ